jgi:hypothetical protein
MKFCLVAPMMIRKRQVRGITAEGRNPDAGETVMLARRSHPRPTPAAPHTWFWTRIVGHKSKDLARHRKTQWAFFRPLVGVVVLAMYALSAAYAQRSGGVSERGTAMSQPNESTSRECARRLAEFVHNLDELLSSNPSTVFPVLDLLKISFPVTGCDIETSLEICRKSKFFEYVSETRDYYVVQFNSRGFVKNYAGFTVLFGLLKESGNSWLPFAKVNEIP